MFKKTEESESTSIKFRKKKTKSGIRTGAKVLNIILISGITAFIFSGLLIEYKYKKIIDDRIIEQENDLTIEDYTKVATTISPALVKITNKDQTNDKVVSSTGIVIDENGIILTNYSSIKDLDNIYVKLQMPGVKEIKAEFVGGDELIDVAIIKIQYDEPLEVAKFANPEEIKVGQEIAVISRPIEDGYVESIIPGIITSTFNTLGEEKYKLIQVSAFIDESNNGGAICNSNGELIGIASSKITIEKNKVGLYYGVNLKELKSVIAIATKFKDTLGLVGGSLNTTNNGEIDGFYVQEVEKGSLADEAGIQTTDIIIEVNGIKIKDADDMQSIVSTKKDGDEITLKIMNSNIIREVKIEYNDEAKDN